MHPWRALSTLDVMQQTKAIQIRRPFSSFFRSKKLHSWSWMCRKRRQEHKSILGGGGLSPSSSTAARFLSSVTPHPLFSHKEVDRGIFHIEEKFFDSWNRANIFYVVGSQKDLLIDTGRFRHLANGMAVMLLCTGGPQMARTWLRESCRQVEAEQVSNS